MKRIFFYIILLLYSLRSFGSHIIGGEMTYQYMGKSGSSFVYQVSLSIYEDCKNGNPLAIAQDNPAIIVAYDGVGNPVALDTAVYFDSSISVPTNFSSKCITNPPEVCCLKKTFQKTYYFPPNATGYIVTYQRCCRNAQIVNIEDPGNTGCTYYCRIPPYNKGTNNSAVFKNYPPLIICNNNPMSYDNSATDADGDSLSYGLCQSLDGGSNNTYSNPVAAPPPYQNVTYLYPYSYSYPMASSPAMAIDPVTGLISGTPNLVGRYLISMFCVEWRHGVPIDTIRREFQFVVTSCQNSVVADIPQLSTEFNTYIVSCSSFNVFFENTSIVQIPDSTFLWNFGVPGSTSDTSDLYQPSFTYPDTGTFVVKLIVNPRTDCTDSIERYVKVYPYFAANFDDSGLYCPGSPIQFTDLTSSTIKPITSWYWLFGDGDTSNIEFPTHVFQYGGVYNVSLISNNIKDCVDTITKQLLIDNFNPNAGDDTTIVVGSTVYFNANGGTEYLWKPATDLNDSIINDPVGYYPDTGTYSYSVFVRSELGCSGYDTITVKVVDQPSFFVPSAFTPGKNGIDGIFCPIAVGYSSLNYFRVFDRWGNEVYYGNSFKEGEGWDGTYKKVPQPLGVYFWELSYTDRYGNTGTKKGDVTLIR